MAFNKKQRRAVRAGSVRVSIALSGRHRLGVFRSNKHIYAQLISPCGKAILASASSLDKSFKERSSVPSYSVAAASLVGTLIAERAVAIGVTSVAFDRSGYKYHGKVRALADAARSAGLVF
ncbi:MULTISPECIES: 50S ribosomal protein L18 [Candidatus Ichthyocystis]|uniref:50S ribosomal protein L18 n=1 Tax=Candidatus Ichthyocystis TaxID=2929841 RepID=UPI000AAB4228|nr:MULTISPECIES: 50S ribosomal protein L18 [Ichthyocystis]